MMSHLFSKSRKEAMYIALLQQKILFYTFLQNFTLQTIPHELYILQTQIHH